MIHCNTRKMKYLPTIYQQVDMLEIRPGYIYIVNTQLQTRERLFDTGIEKKLHTEMPDHLNVVINFRDRVEAPIFCDTRIQDSISFHPARDGS